jgi:pSer/pThr/pTyr-binding forkhead associated (FHA) protein
MPMPDLPLHQHSPAELKKQLEAQRRGAPFLVLRDGAGKQQIIELGSRQRVMVGRGASADVELDWDGDVSRVHSELELVGDQWTITDDGLSRNGTFLNGERVRGRRRLADADRLRFGKTTVTYRAPAPPAAKTTFESSDLVAAAKLTDAQRRVLVALARPYAKPSFATPASNQQIADELFLSVVGVKTHLRTLFTKFGVEQLPQNQKRTRLIELAFQSGTITERDLTE